MTTKKPPDSLSKEARRYWIDLNREWDFDRQALIVLKTALEAYDRLNAARETIDREGVSYRTDTGYIRENPALKVEKQARDGFLAAWRMLNLGLEPPMTAAGAVGEKIFS